MADERKRSLLLSKYYCSERALEIKAELGRLSAESATLKEELDATNDPGRQGEIRRRRAYLSRRIDELKVERTTLTSELQITAESLKAVYSAG